MRTLQQNGDGRVLYLLYTGLLPSGDALGFAMDLSDLLQFQFDKSFGSNQSGS
jgi:hypothetical protein